MWISLSSDTPVGICPLSVCVYVLVVPFFPLWVVVRMGKFRMVWCILCMSSWGFCSGLFSDILGRKYGVVLGWSEFISVARGESEGDGKG